ncbi:hypothetical protein ACFX11_019091 [Malus domestica]
MMHFVDKDTNLVVFIILALLCLKPPFLILYLFSVYSFQSSPAPTFHQSTTSAFMEHVFPEILVVSEVINPQVSQAADRASLPVPS